MRAEYRNTAKSPMLYSDCITRSEQDNINYGAQEIRERDKKPKTRNPRSAQFVG